MPSVDGGGFGFEVVARTGRARLGRLATPHGVIETPAFIFCATKGAIKGLSPAQMRAAGATIQLANTYHLMIQPTAERVARFGGLHRFMGWDGPLLTDSGGFQIFSMGHGLIADEIKGRRGQLRPPTLIAITEDGATFRSYLDGRTLVLTPERSIEIQHLLGADLIVQFDECTPYHVDRVYTEASMRRSHRWGDRSLAAFRALETEAQALYGIIQGGIYPELREESAAWTAERPFFGTAIGGSLGGTKGEMAAIVETTMAHVHPGRPVHLLGIGGLGDIFAGVAVGIDSFDCVGPTRIARHGWALAPGEPGERINLRNARFRDDPEPLRGGCGCYACRTFSRAYLHHLVKADELLGLQMLTLHNVATMSAMMAAIRAGIAAGDLAAVRAGWLGSETEDNAFRDQNGSETADHR